MPGREGSFAFGGLLTGKGGQQTSKLGSLSKGVFEWRTSTGSEIFFILKQISQYQICIS